MCATLIISFGQMNRGEIAGLGLVGPTLICSQQNAHPIPYHPRKLKSEKYKENLDFLESTIDLLAEKADTISILQGKKVNISELDF